MGTRIKLGLIGVQKWGKKVGTSMAASDKVELAGVYDLNADAAASAAAQWNTRPAASLDELLASDVAGVVIVTPNHTHAELGVAAARAGKHPMIIKPFTNTMAEGRSVLEACREAGVFAASNHPSRKSVYARWVKRLLDAGEMGQVLLAVNVTGHNGGMHKTPEDWRARRSAAPGGPLMQLTVHTFDTWAYWFGPIEAIQAAGGHAVTPGDNDDHFAGQARFASGLLANFATQYASPGANFDAVYGTTRTVSHDRAGIRQHFLLPNLAPMDWPRSKEEPLELEEHDAIRIDVEEFAADIVAGRQPHASGEDGLRAVAAVHAALLSRDRGGAWVTIEEVMAG
ncbi:MAG: 1,5-anhydro-D-fructose reductase [Phycisphaerae bacterium]|nr:1,5-anhydro-D-fructose reductase [Phycisphaerae bacterium]